MKKSKFIALALITSALASCSSDSPQDNWDANDNSGKKVYMRSDTTASYSPSYFSMWMWYYAFRPYGYYSNGAYTRAGFYSSGISEHSNIGRSNFKSNIVRGGFGGRGFSISS